MTDAEKAAAAAMLEDGCSYSEVGRTLGRNPHSLRRHFPGMGWERHECGQFAALQKRAQLLQQEVWGVKA